MDNCETTSMTGSIKKMSKLTAVKGWFKSNLLLVFTVLGVILGIILGLICREFDLSKETMTFIAFPGDVFMRALYMIVVPLLFSSVISGIVGTKSENLGRTGAQIIGFYLSTTIIASLIGTMLGLIFKPGSSKSLNETVQSNARIGENTYMDISDVILDLLRNVFPDNIMRAMMQSEVTKYKPVEESTGTNNSSEPIPESYHTYDDMPNFVGVIVFSIFFGIAIRQIEEQAETLKKCLVEVNEVLMQIVNYIMYYSPVGLMFLIAGNIGMAENFENTLGKLVLLSLTTILGMALHAIFITIINFALTRKNPFRFMAGLKNSMAVAWATSSSYAALPTTIRCAEELGIAQRISRLVLPIGATVNMDAGSMHTSLVSIYIAQLHNIPLPFGLLMKITLYAAFTSIGASAIPNSFFAALLITLKASGLPLQGIGIMFATEWILDRFKTCLNVYGDCVGANIVNKWQADDKIVGQKTIENDDRSHQNAEEII